MRMHSERVPANSRGKAVGIIPAVVHATPEFTWYRSRLNAEYEIAQSIIPYPRWEIVVEDAGTVLAAMVLSALLIWRHRGNIKRLLAGQEPRVGQKKAAP